jgi:hypothetical protein
MFIALQPQYLCVRSSGAPCALACSVYMPAPNGAGYIRNLGYKHVAPPEQEPSIPMMTTFRAKLLEL